MGIPLYWDSAGQPGVGSGGGVSLSLCGSSVKGTWRKGSLAGDPEGYVEKALEMGISFHRGPIWGTWRRAHLLGTFQSWMKGLWGWSISLYRGSVEGASGGAPLLWTLQDMLRNSPDMGISLHVLYCIYCVFVRSIQVWILNLSSIT